MARKSSSTQKTDIQTTRKMGRGALQNTGVADCESRMRNRSSKNADAMRLRLHALTEMERRQLLEQWQDTFATPPAKYLSQQLMQKAIAYELQCCAFGRVSKSTTRVLTAKARGKKTASTPARTLTSGTRLLREWNGKTYEVEVTKSDFVWRDKHYRSLSAIAREITGTRWSGPRFFGVDAS